MGFWSMECRMRMKRTCMSSSENYCCNCRTYQRTAILANRNDTQSNSSSTSKTSPSTSPASAANNNESRAGRPKKQARTTYDDSKAFYHNIHQDALAKLDPVTNKLGRLLIKFCCAILFVSFGIFHRHTKISVKEVRANLETAIDSKPNWRQVASHPT